MIRTDDGILYEVNDIYKLRNKTKIGDRVRFETSKYNKTSKGYVYRIVSGKVVKKYPRVFELDNGETHSWVDYFLGKQM